MTALATHDIDTGRSLELPTLRDILEDQQARKIDMVIPASQLNFQDGQLVITGQDAIVETDEDGLPTGMTDPNGTYSPTPRFDDSLAEKADMHVSYLRRLRHGVTDAKGKLTKEPRLDMLDYNVNNLLHGRKPKLSAAGLKKFELNGGVEAGIEALPELEDYSVTGIAPDARSFFVRLFRSDETRRGIARVLLSSQYGRLDNLDGIMAMLKGIEQAGIDPSTLKFSGDLTETRMYVHVQAPQIAALAPKLLEGYRSPFDNGIEGATRQTRGYSIEERIELGAQFRERGHGDGHHSFYQPGTEPIVHAGFKLMNSEVGNGRWVLFPELTVLRCSNGLTQTKEIFARTHVGSKMDDGHIEWSAETQSKELAWVTSQTADLVKLALSQEYLDGKIAELEGSSGTVIANPDKTIDVIAQKLKFAKSERDGIFSHFMMGGSYTAGGVLQAVTSFSQTLDADAAYELDNKAMRAFELAVA